MMRLMIVDSRKLEKKELLLDDAPKFLEAPLNLQKVLLQVQLINRAQEE